MLSSLSAWPWSMVASIIGFCTLCMVFYVNFVRPRLRLRKLSYPAHAYFVVPNIERECGYAKQDAEDEHLIKVAVLPTNSEVTYIWHIGHVWPFRRRKSPLGAKFQVVTGRSPFRLNMTIHL